MKVLAVVLLCAFAAVQGRSAIVSDSKAVATLGENPWVLHLRIATSTSGGFLHTCGASLISATWGLCAAECMRDLRYMWISYGFVNVINPSMVTETAAVRVHPTELVTLINIYWHVVFTVPSALTQYSFPSARFIWIRFGAVDVINPSLVTETSSTISNSQNAVGLININRHVETTDYISPVALVGTTPDLPDEAKFCGFGSNEAGAPGEVLECFNVSVEKAEDGKLIGFSDSSDFNRFDIGMPLVADAVQIGVLVDITEDKRGVFVATSDLLKWIEDETGLEIIPESSESSESWESDEDYRKVKIVN